MGRWKKTWELQANTNHLEIEAADVLWGLVGRIVSFHEHILFLHICPLCLRCSFLLSYWTHLKVLFSLNTRLKSSVRFCQLVLSLQKKLKGLSALIDLGMWILTYTGPNEAESRSLLRIQHLLKVTVSLNVALYIPCLPNLSPGLA